MWQIENTDNTPANAELKQECNKIIKKSKKNRDNNLYFNIQIVFMMIILLTSFILKNSNSSTFEYVKANYREFFETDTYIESTFSYNSFIEKMQNELQIRFGQLITVFNYINSKGSADIYPDNVSLKKISIDKKGITPLKGYISSPYGIRTNPFNSKEKEFHTGLDIAAPKGTFIKAAFSGTVIAAGESQIAGNYIRIESDGDITTLYAHNQFNFVKEGDRVLAGQVIAATGETGLATGPHLHFEFIVDGTRYNPVYALDI